MASTRAAETSRLTLLCNIALTSVCGIQRALDAQIMPDGVLMGRVLYSHARCKDWHGAMATFCWMYEIGVKPGAFTFKCALQQVPFLLVTSSWFQTLAWVALRRHGQS